MSELRKEHETVRHHGCSVCNAGNALDAIDSLKKYTYEDVLNTILCSVMARCSVLLRPEFLATITPEDHEKIADIHEELGNIINRTPLKVASERGKPINV